MLTHSTDYLPDVDDTGALSRADLEVQAKALRALNSITEALSAARDPREVFGRAVEAVARFTRFPAVAIFELNEQEQRLDLLHAVGFAAATVEQGRHLPLVGSVTGEAVRHRELILSPNVSRDPRTEPKVRERLAEEGFCALASVPLVAGERVQGALNLIFKGELGLSPSERDLLLSLGRAIALAIERAHDIERVERERNRAQRSEARVNALLRSERHERAWRSFMHQASITLAGSLDYEATLAGAARLVTASLADWCVVDMLQPEGGLLRLAGAHADATKEPLVDRAVRAAALAPRPDEPVLRVIREGRPVVSRDLEDRAALAATRQILAIEGDHEPAEWHALAARIWAIVPLYAGRRALGALTMVSSDPLRWAADDIEHAQELARLCGLAADNARLYREARDALAVRDEFLSVASHELRTPLTALQLDLDWLERKGPSYAEPSVLAKVARARQQTKRLAKLCEGMGDVSRLSSMGGVALDRRQGDLQEVAAAAVERSRPDAERARCTLDLAPGPPAIGLFDRRAIEQVVSILLANAMKYGAGYPIKLAAHADDGHLHLAVSDQGIGIAEQDAARIFERFERAAPTRHYGGLGLGLYVAREIVQAHEGAIFVASKPGAGATFTVVLPRGPAAHGTPCAGSSSHLGRGATERSEHSG